MDTTLWVVVGVIGFFLVVGVVLFVRSRQTREEEVLHFRCPNCKRKLRYHPRQAGHKGMCNSCKGTITFPGPFKAVRR
jgi:ribosomal protein L37AE/L43A